MHPLAYRESYIRNLPHIQPPGATLFVTFRLAGSLPATVIEELLSEAAATEKRLAQIEDDEERQRQRYLEQRRHFGRWDATLDTIRSGPHWLSNPAVAAIVAEALQYRDGLVYDLDTYTIMSNHVHVIFTPLPEDENEDTYFALQAIMHSLKRRTATKSNKVLRRRGQFWHRESYDHIVRDEEELSRIRNYILNNPVKAGLVEHWEEWPWTYCKPCGDP